MTICGQGKAKAKLKKLTIAFLDSHGKIRKTKRIKKSVMDEKIMLTMMRSSFNGVCGEPRPCCWIYV
ncbi:unnamed protein product [Camellia sinensis]